MAAGEIILFLKSGPVRLGVTKMKRSKKNKTEKMVLKNAHS